MTELSPSDQESFDDRANEIFDDTIVGGDLSEFARAIIQLDDAHYRRTTAVSDLMQNLRNNLSIDDVELLDPEEEVMAYRAVVDIVLHDPDPSTDRLKLLAGLAADGARRRADHHASVLTSQATAPEPLSIDHFRSRFLDHSPDHPDTTVDDYINKLTDIYRQSVKSDTLMLERSASADLGYRVSFLPKISER